MKRFDKNDSNLDALLASAYYRAGNCGSANRQLSRPSRCGSTLPAMPNFLAAAVPWNKAANSDVTPLAAASLSLVGESVRPFFASLSSSYP